MTTGLHTVNLANKWLDTLSNTSYVSGSATLFAKAHTGDPGSAGTSNASAFTTRASIAWSAAASGSKSASGAASFGTLSGLAGTETWSHISVWDNVSAGNFLYSFALSASKVVNNGDTASLSSHSFALTPLAA